MLSTLNIASLVAGWLCPLDHPGFVVILSPHQILVTAVVFVTGTDQSIQALLRHIPAGQGDRLQHVCMVGIQHR